MTETTPNSAIWDKLSRTDPAHTKGFKRAGGFSGTAIKPMWVWQRLTDHFGPMGKGWGCEKPEFQIVPGENKEVLVFCTVQGWYDEEGVHYNVYGVGGDKVITYIKANEQYNRPERWENDDEAFKKAYTDALMNAFKFIGVGADVHMGRFDDNKYVQQVAAEFNPPPEKPGRKQEPLSGKPYKTRAEARKGYGEIVRELHGCGDLDQLDAYLATIKDEVKQFETELPDAWNGDGADFIGLKAEIDQARVRCDGVPY